MCLGIPGKIIEITRIDELSSVAKVDFGGVIKDINISFVPDAAIGEYIIAHVGVAIGKIDEKEAHRTINYLNEIGEL